MKEVLFMVFVTVLGCLVLTMVFLALRDHQHKTTGMSIRRLSLWLSITILFFYEFMFHSMYQPHIQPFYVVVTAMTFGLVVFLSFYVYPKLTKGQKEAIVHYYIPFLVLVIPLFNYPNITPILILIHYIFIFMRLK